MPTPDLTHAADQLAWDKTFLQQDCLRPPLSTKGQLAANFESKKGTAYGKE